MGTGLGHGLLLGALLGCGCGGDVQMPDAAPPPTITADADADVPVGHVCETDVQTGAGYFLSCDIGSACDGGVCR